MIIQTQVLNSSDNTRLYMGTTADLEASYPVYPACSAGSMLILVNESTKVVTSILMYNGTVWATL